MANSPGIRAAQRARMEQNLIEVSAKLLDEHGVPGLSLREVARELGVVSSAVYRYVANRDELLTLLLVDSFERVSRAVDDVAEIHDERLGPATRFHALGLAVRRWALENRARWELMYGTPVRGYRAPASETTAAGTKVVARIAAITARRPSEKAPKALSMKTAKALNAATADLGVDVDGDTTIVASVLWSALVGAINFEMFEQWGADLVPYAEETFTAQLEVIERLLS